MICTDTFQGSNDPVVNESDRINRELKAIFDREVEYFERQLRSREMVFNPRGLVQVELGLREHINKVIADIDKSLREHYRASE